MAPGLRNAATVIVRVGDNDVYGNGIPDGNDTRSFVTVNTDNRDAGERAATDGAQFTDNYSALFPGLGPNATETGSFLFDYGPGILTAAELTIDMADFQSSGFGAFAADINGVALAFSFDDGFMKSAVRSFTLSAAQLSAANSDGFVSFNLDRNGSGDYTAFDYLELVGTTRVPLPATGVVILGAFGSLALARRRKSA